MAITQQETETRKMIKIDSFQQVGFQVRRSEIESCFLKEARIYNGEKTTSLTSSAGKTGQPLIKE